MNHAWIDFCITLALRFAAGALIGASIGLIFAAASGTTDAALFMVSGVGALVGGFIGLVTTPRNQIPWVGRGPNIQYCPKCKYDLRGDLASGCPECGWNRRDATKSLDS